MAAHATAMHRHTPKLIVNDPRGLVARSLDYYRSVENAAAEPQINHTSHDPVGWMIAQRDPRLFLDASAPANLRTVRSLSGTELCEVSVDSGVRMTLFGETGQPVQSWDGRGAQRRMHYDKLLRLIELFEQAAQGEAICAERLTFAADEPAFADHNQCGRLICHEDPPGALQFNDYALTGAVLEQGRCFTDQPSPGFITRSRFNPLGDLLSRTDAKGNEQRFSQALDGQLLTVALRLNDTPDWLPMVSALRYNAHGQVQQEVAGNGVTTALDYSKEDGRLKRLVSRLGEDDPLQDLRYAYDPVGNVSTIEDVALPIRYFANQRIEPVNHYLYDTLYRLIEATGWEAGSVNHGPTSMMTTDPAMPGNYRQTYRYDAGNNLLELTHVGPQNHGHRLVAAAHSNRCLPVREGLEPGDDDFRNNFDANGNLLRLQPGQTLDWDVRNQLKEVRPVERDSGPDDVERYDYGAYGMRVRKVRALQTNAQTNIIETLYLPGLEIRTHSGTGEVLHVIDVKTGRGSVWVLDWLAGKPEGVTNKQQRFSLTDHLGSSTLELDQDGKVITQEKYYPFGGTAMSNGEAVQVSYKTVRYSGKEQDATGLYYYGFRYYATWLQRWLSPDPAGAIDGLNLYAMTLNNPVSFVDRAGTESAIPQQLNWIWLGAPLPVDAAMNINNFLNAAPGYSATLWVDRQAWSSGHGAALENLSKRVRIANVEDAFRGLNPKVHAAFERERSGPLKNYAAASDIARLAVISQGGFYSDVDVKLARPFPISLSAPGELLFYMNDNGGYSNAVLGASANSLFTEKALSNIANEYSNPMSSTWARKRAYPNANEITAQNEAKASHLEALKKEMFALAPAIKAASASERERLVDRFLDFKEDYAAAKDAAPEYFLLSARFSETVKITGPELIFSVFGLKTEGMVFESGQFQKMDASGESMFRRPSELRRASF